MERERHRIAKGSCPQPIPLFPDRAWTDPNGEAPGRGPGGFSGGVRGFPGQLFPLVAPGARPGPRAPPAPSLAGGLLPQPPTPCRGPPPRPPPRRRSVCRGAGPPGGAIFSLRLRPGAPGLGAGGLGETRGGGIRGRQPRLSPSGGCAMLCGEPGCTRLGESPPAARGYGGGNPSGRSSRGISAVRPPLPPSASSEHFCGSPLSPSYSLSVFRPLQGFSEEMK